MSRGLFLLGGSHYLQILAREEALSVLPSASIGDQPWVRLIEPANTEGLL